MPPKVTDAYKEERRAKWFDHALRCFAEKGYAETTMDDIVAKAKSSKGALYNYFKSKEDLFLQLLDNRNERGLENTRTRFAQVDSAWEKLLLLLRSNLRYTEEAVYRDWGALQMEFLLYASRQPELQHLIDHQHEKFMSFYEQIMVEGVRNGEFRADLDPHLAASLFWKMMSGIGMQFSLVGLERSYEETLAEAERMVQTYVRAKE